MPGIYDLSAYEAWDPTALAAMPTGRKAEGTIVITANGLELSASRTASPTGTAVETIQAWTFTIQTASLARSEVCPASGSDTIGFTATGGAFSLFPDATHRELYVKR